MEIAGSSNLRTSRVASRSRCSGGRRLLVRAGGLFRRRCKGRGSRGTKRRGAAVVEFAVIAPLLFLLIFGMIELGRLIMVQQLMTNASREGARRAVLENATVAEVNLLVASYLSSSSVSGAAVEVTPTPLNAAGFGDPVTVRCSIPFTEVSWLPSPWFLGGTNLTAETVMNAERPE